jgi:hypothetical protein
MGVREALNKNKFAGVGVAVLFLVAASAFLAYTEWPQHHFNGRTMFYSDDDGQSWFIDSAYRATPFDHNGKQAVRAVIYSCNHGKTRFCAYLMENSADDKKQLDAAVADAAKNGQPPSSVNLFGSLGIQNDMLVKEPGAGHSWVPALGPAGQQVVTDGLKDHDDGTLDLVFAE